MADDDKNIGSGGGSEDPWAGLNFDTAPNGNEPFELPDFESLIDEPAAIDDPAIIEESVSSPAVESVAPEVQPDSLADGVQPSGTEPGEPVMSGAADAESFGASPFDALSLGAEDGVFSDEAAWNAGDPLAGVGSNALDAPEPPLAVFPPADAGPSVGEQEILEEDQGLLPAGQLDPAVQWDDGGGDHSDADAMAHLEDTADAEVDPGIVAFTQPEPGLTAGSNPPETDESIVVGEAGSGDGESLVGQSQIDRSTIQIGTGQSGILPFEDWGDSADATATDVSTASTDDANPFGEPSFDDAAAVQVDGGFGEAAGLGAAVGGAVAAAPVRRVVRKRSGGGGIAAVVSVLLGGVLAIPITMAILFWGFKKDPFQIAPKIPASLAFLLPPEFQVAGQGRRTLPGRTGRGDAVVAARSVEDVVADGGSTEPTGPTAESGEGGSPREVLATDEPAADEAGSAKQKRDAKAADDLFGSSGDDEKAIAETSKTNEPRRPPPLDTSSLDEAVTAADRATGQLLAASEADSGYKRLLRDWYTTLSKVGEETVWLEQKAVDSGAEFVAASPAARRTIGRILADERSSDQFAKLSRMWLKSRGRTSDGVVLPGVLSSSRKVGPWWASRVRVSDDTAVPEVAVLSRSQPDASEGDSVVVLGIVFEPAVVWAAVCGRFEPATTADDADAAADTEAGTPARARSDDLFPLE